MEMAPSQLKRVYSVLLHSCRGQCLLLFTLGYAVEIWLVPVDLLEALDHMHSLCLLDF